MIMYGSAEQTAVLRFNGGAEGNSTYQLRNRNRPEEVPEHKEVKHWVKFGNL
jgi:hypothetical protein